MVGCHCFSFFGRLQHLLWKTVGTNGVFSFICLSGQCWICRGRVRFVYWNVKYYLFCRNLCQSQREKNKKKSLPLGFSFSCSTIYNIFACLHFCLADTRMLSVFAWFSFHLMFLWLLPNLRAYKSKVNAHTFSVFVFFPLSRSFFEMDTSPCLLKSDGWREWHIQGIIKLHFRLSKENVSSRLNPVLSIVATGIYTQSDSNNWGWGGRFNCSTQCFAWGLLVFISLSEHGRMRPVCSVWNVQFSLI